MKYFLTFLLCLCSWASKGATFANYYVTNANPTISPGGLTLVSNIVAQNALAYFTNSHIWYVDANGNNATTKPGDISHPSSTISNAVFKAGPYDVIVANAVTNDFFTMKDGQRLYARGAVVRSAATANAIVGITNNVYIEGLTIQGTKTDGTFQFPLGGAGYCTNVLLVNISINNYNGAKLSDCIYFNDAGENIIQIRAVNPELSANYDTCNLNQSWAYDPDEPPGPSSYSTNSWIELYNPKIVNFHDAVFASPGILRGVSTLNGTIRVFGGSITSSNAPNATACAWLGNGASGVGRVELSGTMLRSFSTNGIISDMTNVSSQPMILYGSGADVSKIHGTITINGAMNYSSLNNVTTSRLLGRTTAGTGVAELISAGTGLTLSGGVLSAGAGADLWGTNAVDGSITNKNNTLGVRANGFLSAGAITNVGNAGSGVRYVQADANGKLSAVQSTNLTASLATWTQWAAHPNWWLGLVPAEDGNGSFIVATNSVTGHTAFRIAVDSGNDGGSLKIWNTSNKRVLDTIDGTLLDGTEKKSVDWSNRNLLHTDESLSLDYQNGRAYASDGSTVNLNYNTIGVNTMTAIKDSSYLEVTGAQTNYSDVLFTNSSAANKPYVIWVSGSGYARWTNPASATPQWLSIGANGGFTNVGSPSLTQCPTTDYSMTVSNGAASGSAGTLALVAADGRNFIAFRRQSAPTVDKWIEYIDGSGNLLFYDTTDRLCLTTGGSVAVVNSGNKAFVGGTLKSDTTTTGNVGGGEDNLISYSVPASALSVNGQSLEFDVWGSFAANVNTKEVIVYFGATKVADSGAGGLILNGVAWRVHGKVIRTGATTQTATAELTVGGTLLSGVNGSIAFTTAPAETLSGAITFKCTGTDSGGLPADNNIVQNGMHLKWNPAGN